MTHPSHSTLFSDSSLYDFKCVLCGATDAPHDRRLDEPCKADLKQRSEALLAEAERLEGTAQK